MLILRKSKTVADVWYSYGWLYNAHASILKVMLHVAVLFTGGQTRVDLCTKRSTRHLERSPQCAVSRGSRSYILAQVLSRSGSNSWSAVMLTRTRPSRTQTRTRSLEDKDKGQTPRTRMRTRPPKDKDEDQTPRDKGKDMD